MRVLIADDHDDGLEAMKVLRDAGHTVPFVLMTAGVKDAQAWIDAGVFGQ